MAYGKTGNEEDEYFFTKDEIAKTVDPLNRLLRIIFLSQNVTKQTYLNRHYQYYLRELRDVDPHLHALATHRNNVRRSILSVDRITWQNFLRIVTEILPYDIIGLEAVLKNRETKEVIKFSSNMDVNADHETVGSHDVLDMDVMIKDREGSKNSYHVSSKRNEAVTLDAMSFLDELLDTNGLTITDTGPLEHPPNTPVTENMPQTHN